MPFWKCLHTFLLSCLFLVFFLCALRNPVQMTPFSRAMWAGALFVQIYLTTKEPREGGQTKGQFPGGAVLTLARWILRADDLADHQIWGAMLSQSGITLSGDDETENPDVQSAAPKLSKIEVYLRFWMYYLANGVFQILIIYSVPMYLATSGTPSDFALNAFAVTYITELDDLSDPVEFSFKPDGSNVSLPGRSGNLQNDDEIALVG